MPSVLGSRVASLLVSVPLLLLAVSVDAQQQPRRARPAPRGRRAAATAPTEPGRPVPTVRFVGIYFLVLYGRGELPYAFAVPGGWGDIAIATAALLLVVLVPDLTAHRGWVLAWNVAGFVDIGYAVLTASRLAMADPQSMIALLRLPLSLVPTFLVPIIVASHVLVFVRLLKE